MPVQALHKYFFILYTKNKSKVKIPRLGLKAWIRNADLVPADVMLSRRCLEKKKKRGKEDSIQLRPYYCCALLFHGSRQGSRGVCSRETSLRVISTTHLTL